MAVNPVTAGILTGAASGATMGIAGGPWGIAVGAVAGAVIGGFQGSETQKATNLAKANAQTALENDAANQNALVQQNYQDKKRARGLTDSVAASDASAAGGLGSTSGTGQNSLI